MIQVDTIVHFYFDLESLEDYETVIRNYLNGLKNKLVTEEIISIGTPFKSKVGLTSRVVVRFNVLLNERPSCEHLDDYVGFVFPTMKESLSGVGELISTQNLNFRYVREKAPNHQRKLNWEELQHWSN